MIHEEQIYITRPLLPPLNEFIPYLEKIWESQWLTNSGQFHKELEFELAKYLGVEYLSLFANGSLALITSFQTLRITGEVITTPYSFVATANSLVWNSITPVFVDIDPVTCNLDPDKIEQAITPRTTAILPVHCYGTPCDVERIEHIASIYGLKIIYDAAHAFGVRYKGRSLLRYGDLSVLSFHATKVFNTFEGGAIICKDPKTKERIDYLKNFGIADETTVVAPGINGKMNEVQAAFGLLQLKYIDSAIKRREAIAAKYRDAISKISGITSIQKPGETVLSFSYFPILVTEDFSCSRNDLFNRLRQAGIISRRYFYPLISDMPMYRGLPSSAKDNLPVARIISEQILCLPIYPTLKDEQVDFIIKVISQE